MEYSGDEMPSMFRQMVVYFFLWIFYVVPVCPQAGSEGACGTADICVGAVLAFEAVDDSLS